MRRRARVWAGCLLAAVAIAVIGVVVVNGQKTQREAPLPAFLFAVEIGGQTGFFRSVDGLSSETEVVDYREGGNSDVIRKLAGVTRFANIRLTRVFTGDRSLYDWHATIQKPNPIRVDGRITLMDRQGTPIATWKFVNAFPVKWQGPDLDASKNEVAIETIEIAHEGLSFADGNEPSPPPPPK
jgi:phage tail-like protein